MEPGRWGRITDIYHATIARPPEERASFLGDECHGDESLRKQVEAMVKSHERSGDFIELPAFAVAPELLIDEPAGDLIGQSIGHYRIESLIGVGGMGEVYLARDELLGRKVALKFLPEHLTAEATQLSRFKSEARTASALNHPNILTVHEIGAEGTRQFIATEFIEGITLRALLARGRMNLHDALEIAVQVASALAAAHETGVVHRDIKPENIMLRPDGYAKVLDFGIAKLTEQHPGSDSHEVGTTTLQTQPGLLLGTAHYMSPEQTRGQTVDARSDIWSLGVVLYEMVGGIPPFRGETPSDCIAFILTAEPPPLSDVLSDVPVKLQSILQKALRKNRDERYQTIKEMLADVRSLERELETEGSSPQTKARAETFVSKIKRRKRAALLTLAAGILAAAALIYHFYFAPPAPSPNEKSIAVLPFADLSQTRDQEYFCDGIQEEILTRLAKIAGLKVISRTSTQRFKSAPKNLPEIAKQLGVAHILEGTIQKSADQVRVNVQLINAQNDSHLWATKYDRKLTDIFAVESEIAGKIADTLQAKLSSAEQKVLNARPTESTEAHQLYLRGRYVMEKRTPADLNKAADYFNQAITQDPNYAAAYAGLADCYVLLPQWKQGPVAEYLSKARAAANKALQIDGNLADAHVSLGMVAFGEKLDLREAKREFERAIQLNPNYALAHYCLGYSVLLALGNHDQAIAELKRAIELDPVSSVINTNLGCAYILARRYPEAIAQLRKTIELNPGFAYAHAILGEALELNGQLDDAFTEYEKSYNAGHDFRGLMMMAHVHGLKGDRAKALQLLEQAKQLNSPDIWAFGSAMVYVGLGDRNQTLDWLEQSYRQKEFINLSTIKDDPLFDSLHGDPRFDRLVNQIVSLDVIAAGATSIPSKSIAVLPFKPLLAASRDESLEIGMADTLITKLGSLRQIIVRPVSAVRKYASLEQDPVAAGREQRVDAVLDGTVQKSGERIRVTVRLLSAADGQQLWTDKFEEEFTDIFSVEDSISERVAAALAVTLTGADKKQLTKRSTENAEAYQLYLKGRYYAGKYTPEGTKKAIAYFDKAIALDPNYALAYDGLAYCYYASDWFGPPKENFAKGRALVEKALEIDPALAEAHVSLGLLVAWLDYDWPGAEREFKRAFELNANYPPAHLWYGYYLMGLGNFDQSIAEIKRAIELDPLSAEANTCLGIALLDGHRYDEALQQLRTTVEAEPDYWLAHLYFARALEKKGELSAAIEELKKTALIEGAPAEVVSALGYAYAVSGNKAEAEKIILRLKEQSEQSKEFYVPAYGIATIYAGLGDKERAFAYLEKEYANGAFYLNYLKVDPEVDNLRSDPRFADLLRRVRLAP
jgi:TolB-like protein/Tfp pilus assembly protein PilF